MTWGADSNDSRVGDVHLVAVRHLDLDPNIVTRIPARADPDRHRQPGRTWEKVRYFEQPAAVGFGDPGARLFVCVRGRQPPPIFGINTISLSGLS